jgi:hypothetical protein
VCTIPIIMRYNILFSHLYTLDLDYRCFNVCDDKILLNLEILFIRFLENMT